METSKERECIAQARAAKLAAAKNNLEELEKNGIRFYGPASGFGKIEWQKSVTGRIIQLAIYPIAMILALFILIMTPFAYVSHLRDLSNKKQRIKDKIKKLEIEPLSAQVPDEKVLDTLWELHGMSEYKYSFDERVNLLANWIETLYGRKVLGSLDLQANIKKIAKHLKKLNDPYYNGEEGAAHFFYKAPFDVMMRKISDELPTYE